MPELLLVILIVKSAVCSVSSVSGLLEQSQVVGIRGKGAILFVCSITYVKVHSISV